MGKKPDKFEVPADLPLDYQMALCIGLLTVSWSNCESLFYGIFNCVVGKKDSANSTLIWLSTKSTKARIDLTLQIVNAANLPTPLKAEINKLAERFSGVTRTRNFYAHALYTVDPYELTLEKITGYDLDPRTRIYNEKSKPLDRATINELADTVRRAVELTGSLWKPYLQVREALTAQHVELPEPLPEFLQAK